MSEDLFQPPPVPERRNPAGWLTVIIILGLLFVAALSGYLSPKRAAEVSKSQAEQELRARIELGSAASLAADGDLQSEVSKLRPLVVKDQEAALLEAAIETELKQPVDKAAIDSLRKATTPELKAGYEIYSSPVLTPDRAQALNRIMPQDRFVYRIAGMQGMERAGMPWARDRLTNGTRRTLLGVLVTGLLLSLFIGLVLLFGYGSARALGYLRPLGFALGSLSLPNADKVAVRCGQLFATYVGIGLVASLALGWLPEGLLEIVIYPLVIVAFILISRQPVGGLRLTLPDLGIRRDQLGQHVLWGVGAAIANIPILLIVSLASFWIFKGLPSPEHPVTFELQEASPLGLVRIVFAASVAAPFVEEILFRGTLFPALSSVMKSPVLAGIVSSLAFGMIHPTGIPAYFPLACIGGMSCFLAYQTKSLVPSMVMHCVHNSATLVITLMVMR